MKNDITRRNFIKAALSGGILLASGSILSGCNEIYRKTSSDLKELKDSFINDLNVKYVRQIVTENPSTSRRIMWQTDEIMTAPLVEFRPKDSSDIIKFDAIKAFFTDDDHENHQYTTLIEDLIANKDYEYRIVDGEHCSDWHQIKTTDGHSFKMLIFPDSQCADYDVWSKLAENAYKRNADAEIFINIGDIVDNGEDWTQWRAWFNGAESFIDKIPFVPVMGNHETYSRQWEIRLPHAYLNYFDVPTNGSKNFNRYYYSFDYGDVHFSILNSEWIETDDFIGGLMQEQLQWFYNDVTATDKKWKIVFIHRDVLQYRINGRSDRYEGFSEVGVEFMPLFDELGIDVVFTAHLHTYRDRGHIYNFERSPRGPLYILTGIAGDVRYPGLWIDHALDLVKAPQPETDNYLTMEVTGEQIHIRCFLPDGSEIDHAIVDSKM